MGKTDIIVSVVTEGEECSFDCPHIYHEARLDPENGSLISNGILKCQLFGASLWSDSYRIKMRGHKRNKARRCLQCLQAENEWYKKIGMD